MPPTARPAGPSRRSVRAKLLALVVGVLVALVCAELAVRLVWTPYQARTTRLLEPHPVYEYRPIPGAFGRMAASEYDVAVHNGRFGWRGVEALPPPDDGRKRLMVLGDSFVYGVGLGDDATLAQRLRHELPRWQVDAFAANGFGQRQQLAVIDHIGPVHRPDVVLIVFFWNDLEDNRSTTAPRFETGPDDRVRRVDGVDPANFPLDTGEPHAGERLRVPALYLPEFFREALKSIRYRWFGIRARSIRDADTLEQAWSETRYALDLCFRRCRELGARPVVACIPDHNRVDPDAYIPGIEPLNFEVEERLAQVCTELGADWLPTLEGMRAAARAADQPLYYFADRHLTPTGMRAFAELVAAGVRNLVSD